MSDAADVLVIPVRYPSKRYVLASARAEGGTLSVFAPTDHPIPIGTKVRLDITFADCDNTFDLSGSVAFQRGYGRGVGQDFGVGVTFDGAEKRAASQMLAFCAGRPVSEGTAGVRR